MVKSLVDAVLSGELAVPYTRNPLYAGLMVVRGRLPHGKGLFWSVEGRVPRGGKPRTWSGPKGSSHKWPLPGDVG